MACTHESTVAHTLPGSNRTLVLVCLCNECNLIAINITKMLMHLKISWDGMLQICPVDYQGKHVSLTCCSWLIHCVCCSQVIDGVRLSSRTESNNYERSSKGRSSRSRPQSMDSSAYEKLLAGIGSVCPAFSSVTQLDVISLTVDFVASQVT